MPKRVLGVEKLQPREMLAADYVVVVSVDGLNPDAIGLLGQELTPHFHRLQQEGSYTLNARTDYDYTLTMPNHATMMTGYPTAGAAGHGLTVNIDDGSTLHDNRRGYVSSAFDVVHDRGLSTGLYASKAKFALFDRTWNASHGAVDAVGPNQGQDKIDVYVNQSDTTQLIDSFETNMRSDPHHFSFVHLRDPDAFGHTFGWMSDPYLESVRRVDQHLGTILALIEDTPALADRTALVVTADHGGEGLTHVVPELETSYTIPFYVWGPDVAAGRELYNLAGQNRFDPGESRPLYQAAGQPVRNGDAANLALDLLDLPSVPGSTINSAQDLLFAESAGSGEAWWQNAWNAYDVDDDGEVLPRDALIIINALNSGGARPLPHPSTTDNPPPPYLDVTGNNALEARDVLLVINVLNGLPPLLSLPFPAPHKWPLW